MSYLRNAGGRRETPQSEAIPDSGQIPNSAGGYAWEVTPLTRLRRFLILGAEGPTYYASAEQHLKGNIACLADCDPYEAIRLIVEISHGGLAPKNDPALYALAYYAGHPNTGVRQEALRVLPQVARTSTHLFHFAEYVQAQRGWGRSLRRAIGEWYTGRSAADLAYQAVKYRQRDGWTHRDLLRLSHPETYDEARRIVFDWITHGTEPLVAGHAEIITGFGKAQRTSSPTESASLIREYRLPREAIQTEHLTSSEVWEALLEDMPLGALIRNLPTMTRVGLLGPFTDASAEVVRRLGDKDALRKARIHPLQVLVALLTYAAGRSIRGSATWTPVAGIVDALDGAFYASFGNLEATGKRWLIALDVSSSMDSGMINGVPGLTPRVASSALAMVLMATGDPYQVIAFTSAGGGFGGLRRGTAITPLPLSSRQRLDDVIGTVRRLPFGGTDCALPWIYAAGENLPIDVCVTLTDNETWHGSIHPSQALQRYREQTGIPARAIVCGMVSNSFSIADPRDPGQLDVVGFDASAPALMAAFAKGEI